MSRRSVANQSLIHPFFHQIEKTNFYEGAADENLIVIYRKNILISPESVEEIQGESRSFVLIILLKLHHGK